MKGKNKRDLLPEGGREEGEQNRAPIRRSVPCRDGLCRTGMPRNIRARVTVRQVEGMRCVRITVVVMVKLGSVRVSQVRWPLRHAREAHAQERRVPGPDREKGIPSSLGSSMSCGSRDVASKERRV